MQTQLNIEQIADSLTAQLFDKSSHTRDNTKQVTEAIAELTDDYMDDAEIICDTVLDASFIDAEQFWNTLRAMVNAHALGNEQSMTTFAKSISLSVMDAVAKRAEWMVTK